MRGACLLLASLTLACGSPLESPEAQVRALVLDAAAAAEAKEVAQLKSLIAEDYSDKMGRDRKAMTDLLTFHFLRNRSIHLLTRVESLAFPDPDFAELSVLVAMAGRPIPGAGALGELRANLQRFELLLARDEGGAWRVTHASWRPARLDEFL